MTTAPEGDAERRHRAVRRVHDLGGDPSAMERVAGEMRLDVATVRAWVDDDDGAAGAAGEPTVRGEELSDQQRRRFEAFKREVFGPRCGSDGCG